MMPRVSVPLDPDEYFALVLLEAVPGGQRRRSPADQWQSWWQSRVLPHEIGQLARRQGFVVRTSQLARLDIPRGRTRHAVSTGKWWGPAHGVVAPVTLDDPDMWTVRRRRCAVAATAAVLPARARTGMAVGGRSAAVLHGLPLGTLPKVPEIADPARRRPESSHRARVFRCAVEADELTTWFGAPVTTVARTLVDVARHDGRDGIVSADAARRCGLWRDDAVRASLDRAAGWAGIRRARQVLSLASPDAESPLESLVRLALHDAGLPAPELQVWVGGFRVDMLWRRARLVLEVDGLGKYDAREWRREKEREQRLRALGYRVERVTWHDLGTRWPVTVARLRRMLAGGLG